jgi:hypothetical protein
MLCQDLKKQEEFTPEVKTAMITILYAGTSVAREFLTDTSTVTRIADKYAEMHTFENWKRTRCPSKLNRTEKLNALRVMR